MFPEVLQEFSTGHPMRNKLEPRGASDAQEEYDIWMYQAFPCDGLLAEGL